MHKSSPAKSWRKLKARYRLIGSICSKCSKRYYPPEQFCKNCGSDKMSEYIFPDTAKLITWSEILAAPYGFGRKVPYIMAIVETEDHERLTCEVVDVKAEELYFGQKLKAQLRSVYKDGDDGIIHYALKFAPLKPTEGSN